MKSVHEVCEKVMLEYKSKKAIGRMTELLDAIGLLKMDGYPLHMTIEKFEEQLRKEFKVYLNMKAGNRRRLLRELRERRGSVFKTSLN